MKMIFGGMIYLINKFCLYKYLNVVAVRKIGDQTTLYDRTIYTTIQK